jgi:hypothetical protein
MDGYEVEFECGTWLLAERQKRVNTFFYFPDFLFLPVVSSPATLSAKYLPRPAKAHLLAERTKVCQYFFVKFF